MCGIIGAFIFDKSNFIITRQYITQMCDTMTHRGPDGGSVWLSDDGRIGLGHRRLSIIDLSTNADQPMSNEDGSLQIVFNGEIYNHADIRKELELTGHHTWKTHHSDTEVILHAFEEWGIDCFHKFRGMFAIGLWDAKKEELWLIRDRIGIKPLYYSIHHDRIVFGSEIKALLRDPDQKRIVNEEAIFHYMTFLTAPAPMTFFEGIQKLECGTFLKITKNGFITKTRWWDVWDYTTPLINVSEDDIAHQLLDILRTSVQLRKVSDVPVGVFLSGGIDSSINAVLFSEGEKQKIRTFSIGYDQSYSTYQSELPFARLMANRVGAQHFEKILCADDFESFMDRMIYLQDEPLGDPVCMPLYYVSKLARENGVVVCQVGEGSDELFWGYPDWKMQLRAQQFCNIPLSGIAQYAMLGILNTVGHTHRYYYEFLKRSCAHQPIFWGGTDAIPETVKRTLLSTQLRRRFKNVTSWDVLQPIYKRYIEKAWEQSPVHWMSYADLNIRLPDLMLMRVDKMSMGVSLEGRVPFLDHKFVEFAMSIPAAVKTRQGNLKHILKKAVRGLIPNEIIDRKKQGFNVPVHDWFLTRFASRAQQELDSFCDNTGYLDKTQVRRMLAEGKSQRTWYLLNLALWWKKFIAQDLPASHQ